MIYRITVAVGGATCAPFLKGPNLAYGALMQQCGLPVPTGIENNRARFWFTEYGWRQCGKEIAAAARRHQHAIHVVRRKNPHRSQIVYRDAWQVALLPRGV